MFEIERQMDLVRISTYEGNRNLAAVTCQNIVVHSVLSKTRILHQDWHFNILQTSSGNIKHSKAV